MLNDLKKEELETLSYNDIAYMIIKENGKMNTMSLFKEIARLLEMPSSSFENKIGGFYTSITKDQRFLLLEDSNWDLKENHKVSDLIDKIDLDDDVDAYDEEDDVDTYEENDFLDESNDEDDVNDDLKDLVIVSEEELEQEE